MTDKDFLERHWWWIGLLFIGSIWFEAWCLRHQPTPASPNLPIELWLAIGPNLIASLIAVFAGYGIFKSSRRKLYTNTMRSLRHALEQMPKAEHLTDKQAHEFMRVVVPVIASLYYSGGEPKVRWKERKQNVAKPNCSSCTAPHDVKNGQCSHCKDLPGSFLLEERLQLQQK